MRIASGFLVACLCFSGSALCQREIPASPPTLKERPPADHRLYLDVVVKDKAGQSVSNLSQVDFTLLDLDNDRTQPLVSFQPVSGTNRELDPVVQIMFVLDAVNNSPEQVSHARLQLENFLREDNGRLSWPSLVVLFTDTATQIEPAPTRDGNTLAAMLESKSTGARTLRRSAGFWGGLEHADLSLRTLGHIVEYEAQQPGRKLVIWLSSGWPFLPEADLTERDERGIFGNTVDLTDRLEKARITLYTIDPLGMADASGFRPFYYESFLKPLRSWNQAAYANLSLQVLSVQSGGRVLNSSNDLTSEIESCLNDAKAYYTFVFNAPSAQHPDEYHNLLVRVDRPGLAVRTRFGYYSQPYQQ